METAGRTLLAIGVAMAVLCMAIGGCAMDDFIKVDVPKDVRETVLSDSGAVIPARVTLREAREDFEDWVVYVGQEGERLNKGTQRFAASIERGEELSAIIGSLGTQGLAMIDPMLATVPGGPFLTLGLGAMAGWLGFKQPGQNKSKEKSFNKGQDVAMEAAAKVLTAAGVVKKEA